MADVISLSLVADALSPTHHLFIFNSHQISSSVIYSIDAVAPPPVRSSSCRTFARRTLLNRRRRTRRKSPLSDNEGDSGFFGGDDGSFYGGFGGGRGWNFGGSGSSGGGGFNWDDFSSSPYPDDPAFDFVYEVVCWFVFSNCLHFAFKKVVRLVTEDREKVTLQLPLFAENLLGKTWKVSCSNKAMHENNQEGGVQFENHIGSSEQPSQRQTEASSCFFSIAQVMGSNEQQLNSPLWIPSGQILFV